MFYELSSLDGQTLTRFQSVFNMDLGVDLMH